MQYIHPTLPATDYSLLSTHGRKAPFTICMVGRALWQVKLLFPILVAGLRCKSETSPTFDAGDGYRIHCPETQYQQGLSGTQEVPIFAQGAGYQSSRSGVVFRYHLHSDAWRLRVSDGGYGLAQPLCAVLGDLGTPWTMTSALARSQAPSADTESPTSSTRIRAYSLPAKHSPANSKRMASRSAWMARAAGWTMCLSKGYGGQ